MNKLLKKCDCYSYNLCTKGTPNVILPVPANILAHTDGRETVCIDACIADVIAAIWERNLPTLNSCCGHGKWKPQIIIPQDAEPADYLTALAEIDPDRDWVVSRWERVEYTAKPAISEQCEISQKRLEVIGYGSVPASIEEQRIMARTLLSTEQHDTASILIDEKLSRELFEKRCAVNIERNKWHPEHYAHLPAREQWNAWEDCRAEMLKAQPVSEPVAWRCDKEETRGVVITVHKTVADSWVLKGWKVTPLIEVSYTTKSSQQGQSS